MSSRGREELHKLQALKSLKLVRKYRDSSGRARVAPCLDYLKAQHRLKEYER